MFYLPRELESEAKIVLRIAACRGALRGAVSVGDPCGAGFADRAVLRVLISDPLRFPGFLEQSSFPPACIARRVGLSILVPKLDPPVVARRGGQLRSAIHHGKRFVRSDAAAVPHIRLATQQCGLSRHLDSVGRLPCSQSRHPEAARRTAAGQNRCPEDARASRR